MKQKQWKIYYFIDSENRYGFIEVETDNPYKWVKEANLEDWDVSYEVYAQIRSDGHE